MDKEDKEKRKQIEKKFRRYIVDHVNEAEERIREEYGQYREPDSVIIEIARSKAAKDLDYILRKEGLYKYNRRKHKRELEYSKENVFPRKWMESDKLIRRDLLNKHPSFCKILNNYFNANKYFRKDKLKEMIENNKRVIGDEYKPEYTSENGIKMEKHFASFYTDKKYYEEVAKSIGCKPGKISLWTRAMVKVGLFPRWKDGRYYMVADGYFEINIDFPNTQKRSLIKNDPECIEKLRELPKVYTELAHPNKKRDAN